MLRKNIAAPKRAICISMPQKHNLKTRCWKMKCGESSETRFREVSGRTDPCLRGKRPFKDCKQNSKTLLNILITSPELWLSLTLATKSLSDRFGRFRIVFGRFRTKKYSNFCSYQGTAGSKNTSIFVRIRTRRGRKIFQFLFVSGYGGAKFRRRS